MSPVQWGSRLLLLVLVLALAGCGQPTDDPASRSRTLTPVPLPDDGRVASGPEELAPGVDRTGVYDPVRLADAHADVLRDESYTAVRRVVRRRPSGAVVERINRTVRVAADRSRYRYRVAVVDPAGERAVERYADGQRIYVRTVSANRTRYRVARGPDGQPLAPREASFGRATDRDELPGLFVRLDLEVAGTYRRNGTRYYRLVTAPNRTRAPERGVSAEFHVSERGLVRRYHLAYRTDHDAGERVVTVDVRFENRGTTVTEPPEWYEVARRTLDSTPASLAPRGVG